jgi:hypothetical protein
MKLLGRRIQMMEMKSLLTSPIPANHALPAGLLDKGPLDELAAPRDSLYATAHAAVVPAALHDELGSPVSLAGQIGSDRSGN